ncbi:MAG: polymer-forming cytoskeletal protein [Candidatus Cloacimonetes bacterium]|nr:polymer-forming cytoskeletal protein [Candidatus Cloacimonadota bacterium]
MTRNKNVELSTIIGRGSKISGTLKVDGGVRIDGDIEGEIESTGFVTIGATGNAKANIKAQECLIAGKVSGNVSVNEALELDKTANLSGDITAKTVKINAGAVFNGNSSMSGKSPVIKQTTFLPKHEADRTETKTK